MLRELLGIFRSDDPLSAMGANFASMLEVTYEMTVEAGGILFGSQPAPEGARNSTSGTSRSTSSSARFENR